MFLKFQRVCRLPKQSRVLKLKLMVFCCAIVLTSSTDYLVFTTNIDFEHSVSQDSNDCNRLLHSSSQPSRLFLRKHCRTNLWGFQNNDTDRCLEFNFYLKNVWSGVDHTGARRWYSHFEKPISYTSHFCSVSYYSILNKLFTMFSFLKLIYSYEIISAY